MTTLALIAAVARNGVIGANDALPWHLPGDLKHFRQVTLGRPVIMGRKTWESLAPKFRPLPGRRNIVVSRQSGYPAAGAEIAGSLDAALALVGDADEAFVIGGAELYRQAIGLADRLVLTEIDADIDGNVHFPVIDRRCWRETARLAQTSQNGLRYAFVEFERSPETVTKPCLET